MDVGDPLFQIVDRLAGALTEIPVRVVNIPQGFDVGAPDLFENRAQPPGVGISAVGFHQQPDALVFGEKRESAQRLDHHGIIHRQGGRRFQVSQNAHERATGIGRQFDVFESLGQHAAALFGFPNAAGRGKARDAQPQSLQGFPGGRQFGFGKRLGLGGVNLIAQSADLDPGKAQILGHRIDFLP